MNETSKDAKHGRVKRVRKRLADGTIKVYIYERNKSTTTTARYDKGTIGALTTAFRGSPEFSLLGADTQKIYIRNMIPLEAAGALMVADYRRHIILGIRDVVFRERGPAAANKFISCAHRLFEWAIDRDVIQVNPCRGIDPLPGGEITPWTVTQADYAQRHLRPEHYRRAVVLARYTAQRRADLCAMNWGQYDGQFITLTQLKTGRLLVLAVAPELRVELEVWRDGREMAPGAPILTMPDGRRMNPDRVTIALAKYRAMIGLPDGLSIHGLRKTRLTELADHGAPAHEIMAVSGHKTIKMVEHYTKAADQKRLATAAQKRLETAVSKKTETGS